MKLNANILAICITAILCSAAFYLSIASLNGAIIQAATIAGDKMSPALQPTEHTVSMDGSMSVGNRKNSSLTLGITMGKGD